MGSSPLNLALRFVLELSALFALGIWGWRQSDNWISWCLAFGIPVFMAGLWGTFAVTDDPSRSGTAPISVSGPIRLCLELSFFTLASCALFYVGYLRWGWIFSILVIIHYLVSYDRLQWLLSR